MKVKTSEAEGKVLDYLVAKCEGVAVVYDRMNGWWETSDPRYAEPNDPEVFNPSTDWAQGGPVIEREKITLEHLYGAGDTGADVWVAMLTCEDKKFGGVECFEEQGPTALVAAMRCYVGSQLGNEVEVPDEIIS
jgi:hypothetical protein